MRPRRIGLAGLGVISAYYLAALQRSARWEPAALCDPNTAVLRSHRDRVPCYVDHRTMLREAGLDAVVVAVPNHAHAEVCREALRAGIPVCVEKPLAVSLQHGRELTALARRKATPLFTAFHRRYNEEVTRLRRRLPDPDRIASVRVRYLERIEDHIGTDTWYLDAERCGGGCLADNGPNAFDLVRLLLGDTVVTRAVVERDAHGTDRRAVVDLRGPGGAEARVELDWSHPGETKDIEVRLTDGTTLHADMLARHPGFKASLWHEYDGVLDDFATVVATGEWTDAGLAALELVAAGYRNEETAAALGGHR